MTTLEFSARGESDAGAPSDDYTDVDELYSDLESAATAEDRRDCRRRIVEKALPLADHIAYRFLNRGESREDLLQVARLALVKAVHRYDRRKGRFVAFAVPTILGEIRRHFRDNTWGVHVPRRYQESTLAIRAAGEELSQRNGHSPTALELARELDLSPEEIRDSEQARRAYRPVSLDAELSTDDGGARPRSVIEGKDDPGYSRVEDLTVLAGLIAQLPTRERAIIHMRFFECRTQRDIAGRLGVSQVQISRLLKATIENLRVRMCIDCIAGFALLSIAACHVH